MSSISCEICPKTFSKRSNYARHLTNVHKLSPEEVEAYLGRIDGKNPTFQCPDCDFVGSVNHKTLHVQSCPGKEYPKASSSISSNDEAPEPKAAKLATSCKYCTNSYSSKYKLRDHCKNVHGVDINLEDFAASQKKCPNCQELQNNLSRHLLSCHAVPVVAQAGKCREPRATATSTKAKEIVDIPRKVNKRSFSRVKDLAEPFLRWFLEKAPAKYTIMSYMNSLELLLQHFGQDSFSVSSFVTCFQRFDAFYSGLKSPKESMILFNSMRKLRDFLEEVFDFQLQIPSIPSSANVIESYFSSIGRKLKYEEVSQSHVGEILQYNESQLIQIHDFVLAEVVLFTKSEEFIRNFTKVDFQNISSLSSNHLFQLGSEGYNFPDSLFEIMKLYAAMVRPKLLKGKWSPNDEHKFFSIVYNNNLVSSSGSGAATCIQAFTKHPLSLQLCNLLEVDYTFTPIGEVEERPLDMSIDPEVFSDGASSTSFAEMDVADSQSNAEVEAEPAKETTVSKKAKSKKVKVDKTSTGKLVQKYLWIFGHEDHRILTIALEEFKKCFMKKASARLLKTYFVCNQTDENKEWLQVKREASGLEEDELYEVMAHYINKTLL